MTRRLAAILAADVVGYSALMNEDDAGTLAALQAHRAEVFDPVCGVFVSADYRSPITVMPSCPSAVFNLSPPGKYKPTRSE